MQTDYVGDAVCVSSEQTHNSLCADINHCQSKVIQRQCQHRAVTLHHRIVTHLSLIINSNKNCVTETRNVYTDLCKRYIFLTDQIVH